MNAHSLSNLHVRTNLLSAPNYQQDMMRCSVFELRDINQRNPGLVPNPLPDHKQQEWRESLFWGDSLPSPVAKTWAERLAGWLADAVRQLEERPTVEGAFECLIIARELYNTRADGPLKSGAADLDRRICVVLARDEFRHTSDMIDQRLESILGRCLLAPTPPVAVPTVPAISQGSVPSNPGHRTRFPQRPQFRSRLCLSGSHRHRCPQRFQCLFRRPRQKRLLRH